MRQITAQTQRPRAASRVRGEEGQPAPLRGAGTALSERFEDSFAELPEVALSGAASARSASRPRGRLKLGAAFGAARQVGLELGLIAAVEHTELVELEVLFELGVRVHNPLFTKFRLQRSERGPQPRLDCAQRIPGAFRDFALGESFEVSELHGLALRLGQSL